MLSDSVLEERSQYRRGSLEVNPAAPLPIIVCRPLWFGYGSVQPHPGTCRRGLILGKAILCHVLQYGRVRQHHSHFRHGFAAPRQGGSFPAFPRTGIVADHPPLQLIARNQSRSTAWTGAAQPSRP